MVSPHVFNWLLLFDYNGCMSLILAFHHELHCQIRFSLFYTRPILLLDSLLELTLSFLGVRNLRRSQLKVLVAKHVEM